MKRIKRIKYLGTYARRGGIRELQTRTTVKFPVPCRLYHTRIEFQS